MRDQEELISAAIREFEGLVREVRDTQTTPLCRSCDSYVTHSPRRTNVTARERPARTTQSVTTAPQPSSGHLATQADPTQDAHAAGKLTNAKKAVKRTTKRTDRSSTDSLRGADYNRMGPIFARRIISGYLVKNNLRLFY